MTGHVLRKVSDRGSHVALTFDTAQTVVLSLPPRLLAGRVIFAPALLERLRNAMAQTPTWMATQAKAAMCLPGTPWRDAGTGHTRYHTRHIRHRAAAASGQPVHPALGDEIGTGSLSYQDWATEPFICSHRDRTGTVSEERRPAHPLLRHAQWDAKLYLAGSETARVHPDHMEGALDAADRVAARILAAEDRSGEPATGIPGWFAAEEERTFARYRKALTYHLSRQGSVGVTRMATCRSMERLFEETLDALMRLSPGTISDGDARRRYVTTLNPPLGQTLNRLVGAIMGFNRAPCALRAFPDEHHLPEACLREIMLDASRLGSDFLNEADAILATTGEAG